MRKWPGELFGGAGPPVRRYDSAVTRRLEALLDRSVVPEEFRWQQGCVSRDSMLSMIFKLGMSAQLSWRRLKGFEFLAKVIAGVKFRDGPEQPSSEAKTVSRKREREHSRVTA